MHLVEKYGAWRSRELVGFYENLCNVIFNRYKGLVKYWLTFNEINMILHAPFMGAQGEIDGLSAEIDSLNQEAAIILAQQSDLLQAIEGLDQEISQLEERIANWKGSANPTQ